VERVETFRVADCRLVSAHGLAAHAAVRVASAGPTLERAVGVRDGVDTGHVLTSADG
jgi:hypothetical protein